MKKSKIFAMDFIMQTTLSKSRKLNEKLQSSAVRYGDVKSVTCPQTL